MLPPLLFPISFTYGMALSSIAPPPTASRHLAEIPAATLARTGLATRCAGGREQRYHTKSYVEWDGDRRTLQGNP